MYTMLGSREFHDPWHQQSRRKRLQSELAVCWTQSSAWVLMEASLHTQSWKDPESAQEQTQHESSTTYSLRIIRCHWRGFTNGSGTRRGRRGLAPSANPHTKTAQRKALLLTSPGPRQHHLQLCCSWAVAAPPCSNFTLWSLRNRKGAGEPPDLWHISGLAQWLQLFMISVGGGCRYHPLSWSCWLPLQLLSETP